MWLQRASARRPHEYQLYLAIEDIDHSKTKAKSPQTNGICERLHRTMQNEFYAIAFRKKVYKSLEELQQDLDLWLEYYNQQRTHTRKYCFGKTPMQTFLDNLHLTKEKIRTADAVTYSLSEFCTFCQVKRKQAMVATKLPGIT